MKPRVYVETSVISQLTARLLRDVVVQVNQIVIREWWRDAAERFDLVASALVVGEASQGNPQATRDRLLVLESIQLLDASDESTALGRALVRAHALPTGVEQDAANISVAVVNGLEYLATWNFRPIANPLTAFWIDQVRRDEGYEPTMICTPSQLLEIRHEETHE